MDKSVKPEMGIGKLTYYQKNKEIIRLKAREYYHRRKAEDPTFYKNVLDRNNAYYHHTELKKSSPEQDEEQFRQIQEWIRLTNERDSARPRHRVLFSPY